MKTKSRKVVIITGASSGIGMATAIKLVKSGYQVFGLARRYHRTISEPYPPSDPLSIAYKEDLFIPIQFNIARPESFQQTVSDIVSKAKDNTISGLVNNAGYVEPGAVEDITMNNLRDQFETNFFGHVGFTKVLLPIMLKGNRTDTALGGRIINVSSIAGLISLPLIGAYSATKHALEAISSSLRMELWNTNIKIIIVNPGVIETDIYDVLKSKLQAVITEKNDNNKESRFITPYKKYFNKQKYSGLKAGVVADVIYNALSSPNPKYRYIIGSTKEKLAVRLRPIIPDSLFHSIVARQIHRI
ncbi:MAG TPA: SDR family NAD(P)-dependent oxidoreductase [Nitrososphaeraceae archaeon]|nr:SDR family NAD(P)-dependent oxidoreductase [Nitrososphaeraceae archaeon]